MDILDFYSSAVQPLNAWVAFPEGADPRVLEAVDMLLERGLIGKAVLIDDHYPEDDSVIKKWAWQKCKFLIPETLDRSAEIAKYVELRSHKGMTEEKASELTKDPLVLALLKVATGELQACIGGANYSSKAIMKNTFQIIGKRSDVPVASSFFLMIHDDPQFGDQGVFVFSDCALIIDPTSEELASIAVQSAVSAKQLLPSGTPKVAMLSYSTRMSGGDTPQVQKVLKALELARPSLPEDAFIDGEIQLDAAIIPAIGKKKAGDSEVAGKANVLIFPDLNAGNIGYKLCQRLGGMAAYGPLIQGLKGPVSDLSRGCSGADIANTTVLTLVRYAEQAQR